MKVREVEFGPVLNASGARGFFGEGYWFHYLLRHFGLRFSGSTFVAKTTTLGPRAGNLVLKKDGLTLKHWFPDCVIVKPFKRVVLNSVGLSGPGAKTLLANGRWQQRPDPFFLSFMSDAKTAENRLWELKQFVSLLAEHHSGFKGKFGLQLNFSCPNVGPGHKDDLAEAEESLNLAACLDIPLMPKFSVLTAHQMVLKLSRHPHCDAISVSNSIPWGECLPEINWKQLFGSTASPLSFRGYGDGGLSGKPLLPLVCDYVSTLRRIGVEKPINAGGGILSPKDVVELRKAGASSVAIGSVAILRPWRVAEIISTAREVFSKEGGPWW